jgi:predicted adenine nucleotide alpha hydrolase (AANH) superfamily ATPase
MDTLVSPHGAKKLLLHTCCAPCAVAIVEILVQNRLTPTLFFYNPNIDNRAEYDKRLNEAHKIALLYNVELVEADYNHTDGIALTAGMENEPEQGQRCRLCFQIRLTETAQYAQANDFDCFATSLASSRWKNIEQVNDAGQNAAAQIDNVTFWNYNWRKNGLQNRRRQLIQQLDLYNQSYCGCEYSLKLL